MYKIVQILFIVLIMICFILLYYIYNVSDTKIKNVVLDLLSTKVPVNQFKHDCETELVYAISDDQCRTVCRGPNDYFVRNGACVNVLIQREHVNDTIKCDPRNGVLAYMFGDSQLGISELRCMSLDLGIQPDDVRQPNRILRNGTIRGGINYLEKFPNYKNGVCDDPDHVIIGIPNTKTVRSYGVCVPRMFEKLLDK